MKWTGKGHKIGGKCDLENGPGFAMGINLFLFSKHGSKLLLTIGKNQIKLKGSCQ